jgi:hypothetical protein
MKLTALIITACGLAWLTAPTTTQSKTTKITDPVVERIMANENLD